MRRLTGSRVAQRHGSPNADSGSLHLGTGATFDEKRRARDGTKKLHGHAGRYAAFRMAATEEIVVQVHGEGPFAINYVNRADDPRNQKE